ncbi:MAG: hypothetical protein QXL57_03550 [Candidatus Bathyarchaeia archaeon]
MILTSSLTSFNVPFIKAQIRDKATAIKFLEDIVGLKMDAYDIWFEAEGSYVSEFSGHLETYFNIRLRSVNGELCANFVFVDGNVYFYALERTSSNALLMLDYSEKDYVYIVNRALQQYQLSFNKPYYAGFAKMLENVTIFQNQTIEIDSITLTLMHTEHDICLYWCSNIDGTEVPDKTFSMRISKDGFIDRFSDGWEINKIATMNVNVSRGEALNFAYGIAKPYADKIGAKIVANETTLHFSRDISRKRDDYYVIYPLWTVNFEFNSAVKGICGYSVGIWADNGELYYKAPQAFYGRSATILGSSDPLDEQLRQDVTLCIQSSFITDPAYDTVYYWYGDNTTKENIYIAATGAGRNYSISFYVGHGEKYTETDGTTHWRIYDHDCTQVIRDTDIFPYSVNQRVRFVFLWACYQGDYIGGNDSSGNPQGMPYAWLHTTNLSKYGYKTPDYGGYTFIGFYGLSPALTTPLDGKPNASYWFLRYFYNEALYPRAYNLRTSLDRASLELWGKYFGSCILYNGYACPQGQGQMVVYGDGSMFIGTISQLTVRTYARNEIGEPYEEIENVTVWVNGTKYLSPAFVAVHEGIYNVTVPLKSYSPQGDLLYKFERWENHNTNNSRILNVKSDTSLSAYYFAETNDSPLTPHKPSGNTSIYTVQQYAYTTKTIDPEGDLVYYNFSWGDGTYTMVGPFKSNETASASHTWDLGGTYNITVKAIDPGGKESSWSEPLEVSTINRPPSIPLKPWCHTYTGYVGVSYTWSTSTIDLEGDNVCYLFDWSDGSTSLVGPYASGVTASATHNWTSTGTYYVKVKAKDVHGNWSDWSPSQTMNIIETPPPSGCPFVYVWNGTHYVIDNNVLPAAEDSGGLDVNDYYVLHQPLTPTFQGAYHAIYSLKLCEFGQEHDYIDRVRLFAVDHAVGVNVAVSPYGEILTYANPASPTTAVDNNGIDVLSLLNAMDGSYYQGYNGSYVTLTFAGSDVSNGAKLVIREDGPVRKCPIHVQVLNVSGYWENVATFYTRHYWTTDVINMTGCLPDAEGKMRVRLCFVDVDRIDYVGLDTSPQAEIQMQEAYLVSAYHSQEGLVTLKLLCNDNIYAELTPQQQIKLTFILLAQPNETRTFIFYAEGHYYTITG